MIVAILDSGVDTAHEDLKGKLWNNPGEIPYNGIDDDGNGYIDDFRGWDAYDDDNDETGIIFRYYDTNNYYRCTFGIDVGSNRGQIERIEGGTVNTLTTTSSVYTQDAWNNYS